MHPELKRTTKRLLIGFAILLMLDVGATLLDGEPTPRKYWVSTTFRCLLDAGVLVAILEIGRKDKRKVATGSYTKDHA